MRAPLSLIVVVFVLNGTNTFSQHDKHKLFPVETYVVSFRPDSAIYRDNCGCYKAKRSQRKCVLYSGNILGIHYIVDSTIHNHTSLFNVEYLVVPEADTVLNIGDLYIIAAGNSTNSNYLLFSRIVPQKVSYYHENGFVTGLIRCYKANIIRRFLNKIGFKHRIKDFYRHKRARDRFGEFINSQTLSGTDSQE
jgi:hypothetical protein